MALFHVGAIAALFFFTWKALFVAMFLWWVSGSLGIGMSYHRLLTHRGYKTPKWVEYFLTVCATLALEGGPIFWVATHRIHHQYSDQDGDPHSPIDGKWWAHMGWILMGKSMHHDTTTLARYVPDLAKDKFHVWITKYHYVPMIVLGVVLYAIGGLPFLLWGVFMRTVVGLHTTWLVNSATHSWGTRRFTTRDLSTNSWWVALLTFGEGWHNNHHAHPTAAQHGFTWYEVDMNWYGIWALKTLGLAWDIKRVRLADLEQRAGGYAERTSDWASSAGGYGGWGLEHATGLQSSLGLEPAFPAGFSLRLTTTVIRFAPFSLLKSLVMKYPAILCCTLALLSAPAHPQRLNDSSDWWSISREDSRTPNVKPSNHELQPSNFSLAGITLGQGGVEAITARLGQAPEIERGDASTGRSQLCFASAANSTVHVVFEFGEDESIFYLFSGGAPWKGSKYCIQSKRVSDSLSTRSGLRLGLTRPEVEAILGHPDATTVDDFVYSRQFDKKSTPRVCDISKRISHAT